MNAQRNLIDQPDAKPNHQILMQNAYNQRFVKNDRLL